MQIPNIIHQTWKTKDLNKTLAHYSNSWRKENPTATHILYSDDDCNQFVLTTFPQYHKTYSCLRHGAERADLFRYLIILHFGGVYADIDTMAFGDWRNLTDGKCSLLIAEEGSSLALNKVESEQLGWHTYYKKTRPVQYAQHFFAAEAGHSALLATIEKIVHTTQFLDEQSSPKGYTTIERTGPGVWTDGINKILNSNHKTAHNISILKNERAEKIVQHHFMGSWKNHPHNC